MKHSLHFAAFALSVVAGLAGCKRDNKGENDVATSVVEEVTRDIREEMATKAIDLDGPAGAPDGQLTPAGELLIDGKPVALDAAQRELVLAYRAEVARVAEAGARLGLRGADIAREAMSAAASSVLDNDSRTVEERVKASTDAIKVEAQALCDSMPKVKAAQDALAQAVPEFAPYASMDQSDIDDCNVD